MKTTFRIRAHLDSGVVAEFDGIPPGCAWRGDRDGVCLEISNGHPARVTATPPPATRITSLEYDLCTDLKNYHKVIVPDTGRGYMDRQSMIGFWRHADLSAVHNVFMPLYIFLGQDLFSQMAFGVIGEPFETEFQTLEPRAHRALVAHMRRLTIRIRRGTDLFPVPRRISGARPDGAIVEHLYFRDAASLQEVPWVSCIRDFASHQKRIFQLPDVTHPGALDPLWCSWTDWFSNDVTASVILDNARKGLALGIRNYIIDDGWFGPGLDNERDVALNIGDWEPDPAKIPDMGLLVRQMHDVGARALIWCAPHAVAPGAACFPERKRLLIHRTKTERMTTSNEFHSLCFQNPEARERMAEICASFITRWDVDGAKYDLFNCVPPIRCESPHHEHDTDSMLEGLGLTLEAIDRACRALKPDYLVELKQNYSTPFLARWGSLTRAGDTPYDNEGNFLRTTYIQAYTPYAINDYMTVTPGDRPEEAGCIAIKMMAVGVPSYSVDFNRLNDENRRVLAHYHRWYQERQHRFARFRIPLHPQHIVWKAAPEVGEEDILFLLNGADRVDMEGAALLLNGTFEPEILVRTTLSGAGLVTAWNAMGELLLDREVDFAGWTPIAVPPGGMARIRSR
ncbi:MAG: alpha-galactosidase [Kiritimatiellia bacterium]|nr:alpha-galactosidase [Kiritimatiellia bacterium]